MLDAVVPADYEECLPFEAWSECRFLTCSVLPVRTACNLHCPFCFSRSSISSLPFETLDWSQLDVERYYEYAIERGATRLVITGGGDPLLKPRQVVNLIRRGSRYFKEIACFTNGARLTSELAHELVDSGLNYLCYSRHHHDDHRCRELMGPDTPDLERVVTAADTLPIRATCVMTRGWIDTEFAVHEFISALSKSGIREFTFKHTYVAYQDSLFADSQANAWAAEHHVDFDPFAGRGAIVARLPWGPCIRQIDSSRVCYYYEPTPEWELEHRLCRSINLLSDGTAYASLEDQRSRLFRLPC